jgi:hypothetical protein
LIQQSSGIGGSYFMCIQKLQPCATRQVHLGWEAREYGIRGIALGWRSEGIWIGRDMVLGIRRELGGHGIYSVDKKELGWL